MRWAASIVLKVQLCKCIGRALHLGIVPGPLGEHRTQAALTVLIQGTTARVTWLRLTALRVRGKSTWTGSTLSGLPSGGMSFPTSHPKDYAIDPRASDTKGHLGDHGACPAGASTGPAGNTHGVELVPCELEHHSSMAPANCDKEPGQVTRGRMSLPTSCPEASVSRPSCHCGTGQWDSDARGDESAEAPALTDKGHTFTCPAGVTTAPLGKCGTYPAGTVMCHAGTDRGMSRACEGGSAHGVELVRCELEHKSSMASANCEKEPGQASRGRTSFPTSCPMASGSRYRSQNRTNLWNSANRANENAEAPTLTDEVQMVTCPAGVTNSPLGEFGTCPAGTAMCPSGYARGASRACEHGKPHFNGIMPNKGVVISGDLPRPIVATTGSLTRLACLWAEQELCGRRPAKIDPFHMGMPRAKSE